MLPSSQSLRKHSPAVSTSLWDFDCKMQEAWACAGLPPTPPQHSPRALMTDVPALGAPDLESLADECKYLDNEPHEWLWLDGWEQRGRGAKAVRGSSSSSWEQSEAETPTYASSYCASQRDVWNRTRLPQLGSADEQVFRDEARQFGTLRSSQLHQESQEVVNNSPSFHYHETPLPCGLLPSQLSDILFREITPEDYDVLLQLDTQPPSSASPADIVALPSVDARDVDQVSCIFCLSPYDATERLTKLPCSHAFHKNCIAEWLLQHKPACPLCGQEVPRL